MNMMNVRLQTSDTPHAGRAGLAAPVLLVLSGTVWGLWYFGMNWIGWGEPGSDAYARYETYNRIAPAVLLMLLASTQAVRRLLSGSYGRAGGFGSHLASAGLLLMAAGSALEFWVFTETSYAKGSLRGLGWNTYCIGLPLFYAGTAALGFALRRARGFAPAGALLMGWLPAGALLSLAGSLTGVGLPGLSTAVALCGTAYVLMGWRLKAAPAAV
jgi:hypothetical protein